MQQNLFQQLEQSLKEAGELSKVKLEHSSCPYCEGKIFTLTKRDLVHTYKKVHKIIIPGVIHQYCNDCRQILPTPEEAQRMMALTSTFNKEVDKQNALQNSTWETGQGPLQ
jgi:YgiT-type zinc finger domain-containing protein